MQIRARAVAALSGWRDGCQVSRTSRETTSGGGENRTPSSEVVDTEGLVERTVLSRK